MIARPNNDVLLRRHRLYGVRPLGLGTPMVESLTGFLTRVCRARHVLVRDVLDSFVRPLVPVGTLPPRSTLPLFLVQQVVQFDGMRPQSAAVVSALERLTGLSDLALHTFLPWAGLSPPGYSGAVTPQPSRWCARCFEQWHLEGVDPWEPLLWRCVLASHCPHHRIPLSRRCPSCGFTLSVVADRVPLGYCSRCGHLLHQDDPHLRGPRLNFRRDTVARFDWWTSVALGQMISVQSQALDRAGIDGFAGLIRTSSSFPRVGLQSIARYLGVSHRTLAHWRDGERRPRLRWYLRVCIRLGANPAEVGIGDRSFPTPWREPMSKWRSLCVSGTLRVREREARWDRLRQALDRSIAQGGPRSVRDFARDQGVHFTILHRRFPDRYAVLVAQAVRHRDAEHSLFQARCGRSLDSALSSPDVHSARSVAHSLGITTDRLKRNCPQRYARLLVLYRERSRDARRRRLQSRCRAVRDSVRDSLAEGVRPSLWRAVTRAGLPETLCTDPSVRSAWLNALDDLSS